MKKIILMAGLALCGIAATAQSVLVMKVDEKLNKKDYAGAEQILSDEIAKVNAKWEKAKLKNPEAQPDNAKLAEIYNKRGDVYGMQFNPELMNAAQGLPLDTAKFCSMLDGAVQSYTQSYIYDNTPDAKGKVKAKFNASNRRMLLSMLDYYYYSGVFRNQNQDINGSREEFRKFIELRKNPAFSAAQSDSIYTHKKELYDQAAFNVTLLYYQAQDWDNVLATVDEATRDENNLHDALIMKCTAHIQKGDTAAWLKCLGEAAERDKDGTNFMEQLIYYYTTKNDAASANAFADRLISANRENKTAWYMKGCTQLNLEQDYAGARESFAKALAIDANYPEALMNTAYTYMNEVMQNRQSGKYKYAFKSSYTSKEKDAYMAELEDIRSYYRKALPHVEKVRELQPDQPKRWAPALSMIYANLGMKDEADAIDQLISSLNH